MTLTIENRIKQRSQAPSKAITTEITVLTPNIAAAWLERNGRNRKLSEHTVSRYVRDIKAGQWKLTGETIKFDTAGNLLDGQHRLTACVRAKMPIKVMVVYGLPSETQDVLDTGKSRRLTDVMSLHGILNATRVGSTIRVLIGYKQNVVHTRSMPASHADCVAALERHPTLPKSVGMIGNSVPRSTPLAALCFLHYAGCYLLRDEGHANAMVEVFRTGVPKFDGDPIHQLRERLLRMANDKIRPQQDVVNRTLFECWNKFRKGESIAYIKMHKGLVDIHGLDRNKL